MQYRVQDIDLPRLLLLVLVASLIATVLFSVSTSATDFSVFNGSWDGASELRSQARTAGAESTTSVNTSVYETVDPQRTVAVVLSPDRPYEDADAARLRAFVRGGGTLVVAEDFGPHGNALLETVGAQTRFDGVLVRDERAYYLSPDLPVAANSSATSVSTPETRIVLNHATVLRPANATVAVTTSELAYLDVRPDGRVDEAEPFGAFPVVTTEAVGAGRVIAISDPSVFINAMQERPENRQFTRGLFAGYDTVVLDYSHSERPPLFARLALVVRDSSPLQTAIGLFGIGVILLWLSSPRWLES